MPALITLVGKQFGRLVVLARQNENSKHGHPLWLCQCACGNVKSVSSPNLRLDNTRSCGCLKRETAGKQNFTNLSGQRFGRLTVVSRQENSLLGQSQWNCECDCGKTIKVLAGSLKSGNTESCGCLQRDRCSEACKGSKHPNWKGGKTTEKARIRYSPEYKNWRKAVFNRDDYTCQDCGIRGTELQAHHIKSFAYFPELRFEISNGATLCVSCHKKTPNYLKDLKV